MTRCYEYYCLFECKPDKCNLTGIRGIQRIKKYMRLMKENGVVFDKTDADKTLFLEMVDNYGTEQAAFKTTNQSFDKSVAEPRKDVILSDIKDISLNDVDLILTDPPYPREYLELWPILFEKAAEGLKEGGFLVTYAPHIYLHAIFEASTRKESKTLSYVWPIAQIHTGTHAAYHPSKVKIGWKPVLVFVKGKIPEDMVYFEDVLMGTGREKDDHKWQQALYESMYLIQSFSHEGALVVDPFVGSGTVAVAAQNTGRSFMVYDKDPIAIQTTLRRLKDGV